MKIPRLRVGSLGGAIPISILLQVIARSPVAWHWRFWWWSPPPPAA
jgi:hypothetical protein